jgi:hypothetical protein
MKGDPKFVIYSSVDVPSEHTGEILYRPNAQVPGGIEAYAPKLGNDREVCQFAVDFPTKPVTEKAFRAAFRKMEEACLERARSAGLVLA